MYIDYGINVHLSFKKKSLIVSYMYTTKCSTGLHKESCLEDFCKM